MHKKNYYEILQINKSASLDEIKTAYRRLAKKYHPDLNPGKPYASSKFMELDEAFDTLKDPTLKKRYDRNLSATNFSQKQQQQKQRKTRKSRNTKGPFYEEMRAHNARRKNNKYKSEREEREARENYTKESKQDKNTENQWKTWGLGSYIGVIWVIFASLIAFLGEAYASEWHIIWRIIAGLICLFFVFALYGECSTHGIPFIRDYLKWKSLKTLIYNLKSSISSNKKTTNLKEAWKEGGFSFHGNSLFLIVASIICLIQENIIGKFFGVIGLLFFGSIYATSAYFAYKTFFDHLFKKRK